MRFDIGHFNDARTLTVPDAQETNMIRTFAQIVMSGQLEPRWGDNALRTQQVLDACLKSARADGQVVTMG